MICHSYVGESSTCFKEILHEIFAVIKITW